MISLEQAVAAAKEHFLPKGQPDILRVYEGPDFWLLYGGHTGVVQYGSYGLLINKQDGSCAPFYMQDDGSFERFQQAREIPAERYRSL